MSYQKLINSNIKELRLTKNMTQEEFAEKIGISIQGLSNIERNRYQPTAETIDKICKEFNLSPIELLTVKNDNFDNIVKEISALLLKCPKTKLSKIYEIVQSIIKLI